MAPVVAITATVAAVAVAILVAVQPPVTVGGLDPASGGGAPAGLDDHDWPPAVGTVGPDGWVEVPPERMPTPGDPQDLEVIDGAFVLATEGGQVWASDDGFAWAEIPGVQASMGQRLFLSRAGDTLLVATGEGTMFAGDLSGVDETAQMGQIETLAGGPAGAVAVSTPDQGRQLLATTDGRTWAPMDELDQPLRSVAWDGDGFVGVTDGPDAQVLEAEQPGGPWVAHPGSDTLPPGFWGIEPTEPGFVLIPRADGDQGLEPILWWTDQGRWDTARLPGDGPIVIDDATTIDGQALVAIGTDTSRPELDADRLYRIDRNASQTSVVETGDAFGPTAVLRRAHAVSDGTTAMVAYGRRRAGSGDGLTLWVHRTVEPQTESEPATSQRADVVASQLPPNDSGPELNDDQLEQVVQRARESAEVAEVLSTSSATEVFVQAGDGEAFGAERIAWVVLAFDEPRDPGVFPWDDICDIGGRTQDWLGVVARVSLGQDDAFSSPLWTTGANCMSWFPDEQMPFEVRPT